MKSTVLQMKISKADIIKMEARKCREPKFDIMGDFIIKILNTKA